MGVDEPNKFGYKYDGDETPFEVFLRYTDEKEKSSTALANILSQIPKANILDIGTGNGEYLELTLSKVRDTADSRLTLLEPSSDLVKRLKTRFDEQAATIVDSELDDFATDEKFDVVLASHLFYHIPRSERPGQLLKLLSLLGPRGKLIVVLREKDDAYDFKMAFKPLLFGKDFQALTLEDLLTQLPENGLSISRYRTESELAIPIKESIKDTQSIVEFYLSKPWSDIPKVVQQAALRFIENKNAIFKQLDGIAVIEKK